MSWSDTNKNKMKVQVMSGKKYHLFNITWPGTYLSSRPNHEVKRAYLSEYPSREPKTSIYLQKPQSISACPDLSEGENKSNYFTTLQVKIAGWEHESS